jgi:hypothetical protein
MIIVAGCYSSRHRIGNEAGVIADADKPYATCIRHCRQISRYDVTRDACEQECNDSRKDFPHLDKRYASYESCAGDMDTLDVNRLDIVEEAQAACKRYDHLHKRFGCKEAVAAFYNAATIENVCGGRPGNILLQTAQMPLVAAPVSQRSGMQAAAPLASAPSDTAYQPIPAAVSAGVNHGGERLSPAPLAPAIPVPAPVRPSVLAPVAPPKSPAPAAPPELDIPPSAHEPLSHERGRLTPGSPAPVKIKGSPSDYGRKSRSQAPAQKPAALPGAKPETSAPRTALEPPAAPVREAAPISAPAPAPEAEPRLMFTPVPFPVPSVTPSSLPSSSGASAPETPLTPPLQEQAPSVPSAPAHVSVSVPVPSADASAPAQAKEHTKEPEQETLPSMGIVEPPLPSMLRQKEALPATIPPAAR